MCARDDEGFYDYGLTKRNIPILDGWMDRIETGWEWIGSSSLFIKQHKKNIKPSY